MTWQDFLLLGVLAFVGLQRLVELAVSRRNEARLLARGGARAPRDGFGAILLVHASLYVLLPLEWFLAPWARIGPHTAPFLVLAALATLVRYWAAWSLGDRYTVRVLRVAEPLRTRGPYRWMRHPIYRAVAIELFALPLSFSAFASALVLGGGQILALKRRIRLEETFLGLRSTPTRGEKNRNEEAEGHPPGGFGPPGG